MSPAEKKAIAEFIERTWRERTPAKSVMDVLAFQRVMYSDILNAFPHLGVFGREETVPIHNQVMKRLKKEFPDERWT